MGIVNASPDSFSDAVRLDTLDAPGRSTRSRSSAEGADLIDVGGESGVTYTPAPRGRGRGRARRPARRAPGRPRASASRSTRASPRSRARRWTPGAAMLNDVSGLRDPALAELAAQHRRGARASCTRAPSPSRSASPTTTTWSADVVAFLRERIDARARRTASPTSSSSSIPGPDFAKTPAETVAVLRDARAPARARAPAAAGGLAQVLPRRDHRPPAGRAPGGHARRRRRGPSTRAPRSCACTTSPPSRDCLAVKRRPRRARRGARLRRRRRGAEVDPGRPLACRS